MVIPFYYLYNTDVVTEMWFVPVDNSRAVLSDNPKVTRAMFYFRRNLQKLHFINNSIYRKITIELYSIYITLSTSNC